MTTENTDNLTPDASDATPNPGNMFPESHVKELRNEAAGYRNKLKDLTTEFEDFKKQFAGIDVSEIAKLRAEQERLEKEKDEKRGDFDKLADRMRIEHSTEMKQKDDLVATLQRTIERLEADLGDTILRNEISISAAHAKAINSRIVERMVLDESVVKKDEETGKRSILVLDADGSERISTKTARPMTIAERIAEMKNMEEYAHLFEGATLGAGSRTSFQGKNIANPWKKETFNLTLQGQIVRNDPKLAERFKAEAAITNKK